MNHGKYASLSVLMIVTLFVAGTLFSGERESPWESGPRYTDAGELMRPGEQYRQWVFLGSSLGLGYSRAVAQDTVREETDVERPAENVGFFHNVYMNPEAYDHYSETGRFADGTVMILDVYAAKDREPRGIVTRGHYQSQRVGFEVAVKNSRRPDGSQTPWAYYSFSNMGGPLLDTAKAHANATCYDCHDQHAEDDHVWSQFYPTLQALKKE